MMRYYIIDEYGDQMRSTVGKVIYIDGMEDTLMMVRFYLDMGYGNKFHVWRQDGMRAFDATWDRAAFEVVCKPADGSDEWRW